MLTRIATVVLVCLFATSTSSGLNEGFNYDESKVPEYSLPDPLVFESGEPVTSAEAWNNQRRPEVLKLFENQVYGRAPAGEINVRFGEADVEVRAFGGLAVRKQVKIFMGKPGNELVADLLIYLPAKAKAATPVFVGLNFGGNHTVTDETDVWLPKPWSGESRDGSFVDHRVTEKGRGTAASRWPVKEIVARGYGVATIYCGDFDPDLDDGFQNGIHALLSAEKGGQPAPDEWGSIAAWAWGLSRALDYFETDDDIDHKRVAAFGHSRLGKTALWAGASDERFAMVVSNESGCGGAALSRRRFGETVKRINTNFPHWFCQNFQQYNDNEDQLPIDQHMLLALVAPRPLYVASAQGDQWADPRGEFLALRHAAPAFELLGRRTLGNAEMPPLNKPLMNDVAYHIRTGRHDVTLFDWQRYMDFADRQFRQKK